MTLGLETSDDRRREDLLAKHMSRAAVSRAVAAIGSVAADLGRAPCTHGRRVGLTFNILVGGPGTSLETAADDALATAKFALETGRVAGLAVDLNLHPYYRSARGRSRFPNHASCSPQTAARVAVAIAESVALQDPPPALFVGTEDEGNDRDLGLTGWHAVDVREAFAKFNQSQDASVLQLDLQAGNCAGRTILKRDGRFPALVAFVAAHIGILHLSLAFSQADSQYLCYMDGHA